MSENGLDAQSKESIQIEALESHIGIGLDAIIKGDYKTAISLFSSPEAARQAGLDYETYPTLSMISRTPQNEGDIKRIIDRVGFESEFINPTEKNPTATIRTTTVFVLEPGMYGVTEPVILTPETETTIYHNVALMNAEEWIHALRFKQGIDIQDNEQDEEEEAEVAAYLIQKGVPLTERFLNQYNRRKHLAQAKS